MNSYLGIQILGALKEDRKTGFQAALMKNVQEFSLISQQQIQLVKLKQTNTNKNSQCKS